MEQSERRRADKLAQRRMMMRKEHRYCWKGKRSRAFIGEVHLTRIFTESRDSESKRQHGSYHKDYCC